MEKRNPFRFPTLHADFNKVKSHPFVEDFALLTGAV